MRYSRFDPARGDYAIYETDEQRALNQDFGVPSLGRAAGRVGVPASEAGRRLPRGARFVGRSWLPAGLVVPSTGSGSLGQDVAMSEHPFWWTAAGVVGGAALSRSDSALVGSIIGGGLGYLAWRATKRGA